MQSKHKITQNPQIFSFTHYVYSFFYISLLLVSLMLEGKFSPKYSLTLSQLFTSQAIMRSAPFCPTAEYTYLMSCLLQKRVVSNMKYSQDTWWLTIWWQRQYKQIKQANGGNVTVYNKISTLLQKWVDIYACTHASQPIIT